MAEETKYDHSVLVNTLVYHVPNKNMACSCGWKELGASWAEHVAEVYEFAMNGPIAPTPLTFPVMSIKDEVIGLITLREEVVNQLLQIKEALDLSYLYDPKRHKILHFTMMRKLRGRDAHG